MQYGLGSWLVVCTQLAVAIACFVCTPPCVAFKLSNLCQHRDTLCTHGCDTETDVAKNEQGGQGGLTIDQDLHPSRSKFQNHNNTHTTPQSS